jgi:hypothetical protein
LRSYRIINIILAGLIIAVFIYSGLFSAREAEHPLPSFYEEITGDTSPSAGMSRAFSELVRGRLDSARAYNEDSPLVFAFFLIQLLQRALVLLMLLKTRIDLKILILADVILSAGLFLYCFMGQILKVAELWNVMY